MLAGFLIDGLYEYPPGAHQAFFKQAKDEMPKSVDHLWLL